MRLIFILKGVLRNLFLMSVFMTLCSQGSFCQRFRKVNKKRLHSQSDINTFKLSLLNFRNFFSPFTYSEPKKKKADSRQP